MSRVLLLTTIMLLTTQCSWLSKKFGPKKDHDLVKSFDLKGKKFEQYRATLQEVEMPEEEEEDEPLPTKQKEEVKQKPSLPPGQKKTTIKNKPKPQPEKKQKKKVEKRPQPSISSKPIIPAKTPTPATIVYPADYPQQYKEYDKISDKVWKLYRPKIYVGEKTVIRLSYMGVKAGTVSMIVRPPEEVAGKTAYYLSARLKSAKFYSYIYTLDDSLHTFVDAANFLPIKYSLIQRESGQNVDDLQLFDQKELKTHFWIKKIKDGKTKQEEKSAYIPHYTLDSFSSLYFIRGLPLKNDDEYQIPIVTRTKIWLMKVNVEGRERVEVNGKRYNSIRINAVTHYPGVLKRRGNITFWFEDNEERGFLKFRAKIKIGSVRGERIKLYREKI